MKGPTPETKATLTGYPIEPQTAPPRRERRPSAAAIQSEVDFGFSPGTGVGGVGKRGLTGASMKANGAQRASPPLWSATKD